MIENDLQKQCEKYIESLGWSYIHLGHRGKQRYGYSKNNIGYPDLIIFPGKERVFFVELKNGDKALRKSQAEKIEKLKKKQYKCYVASNYLEFIMICEWEKNI